MDRRKADLSEPGINDLKESGSPAQDSDVTIQIYYPAREKIMSYRDYKILGEGGMSNSFRSIILSKNRYGIANQVIGCGFYGEVGWWKELPKGKEINDFSQYTKIGNNIPCKRSVIKTDPKEDIGNKNQFKEIKYTF